MNLQRAWLLTVLTMVALAASSQNDKHFNFGLKAGFGSTGYAVERLSIEGNTVENYDSQSDVNLSFGGFARINMPHSYFQVDASYASLGYTILFPTVEWMAGARSTDVSSIATRLKLIEMPILYGIYLKNYDIYRMAIYTGPKAGLILAGLSGHRYYNFSQYEITEAIWPCCFSWVGGININIAHFYADLSVEWGVNNLSQGFTTSLPTGVTHTGDFVYDRRKNGLNFSIGFLF